MGPDQTAIKSSSDHGLKLFTAHQNCFEPELTVESLADPSGCTGPALVWMYTENRQVY